MFQTQEEKDQKRLAKAEQKRVTEDLKQRFEANQIIPTGYMTPITVLLDKETGVEYLFMNGAITPLFNSDGTLKVRK